MIDSRRCAEKGWQTSSLTNLIGDSVHKSDKTGIGESGLDRVRTRRVEWELDPLI